MGKHLAFISKSYSHTEVLYSFHSFSSQQYSFSYEVRLFGFIALLFFVIFILKKSYLCLAELFLKDLYALKLILRFSLENFFFLT